MIGGEGGEKMYEDTKIMSNVSILVASDRTVYDDINFTPLQLVHSVHLRALLTNVH